MMEIIATKQAPAAVGPYSQAVRAGDTVYVSGQIALVPASGSLAAGGIEGQTEQVMKNLGAILQAAGADYTDVVKTTCFLANIGDFAAFNSIYGRYFTGRPARSCVAVGALPKGALVEVEAIARRGATAGREHHPAE